MIRRKNREQQLARARAERERVRHEGEEAKPLIRRLERFKEDRLAEEFAAALTLRKRT